MICFYEKDSYHQYVSYLNSILYYKYNTSYNNASIYD